MKKLLLVIFGLFLNTQCWGIADYTLDANCKLAYLFSEGAGTTVSDASVNGNNGTFNSSGHPAWSVSVPSFGVNGSARGSADYSTAGSLEIISDGTSDLIAPYNGAFSFVTWIYPTVDTIGGGDPRIFQRGSVFFAISITKIVYLQIDGSTNLNRFAVNNTLTLNTWQHVAVTWDGNTDATHVHIYKNGSEVSYSATVNGATLTSNSGATTYVGNRADGTRSACGKLTETAFFNRVLTSTEISNIYNYGLRPSQGLSAMLQVFE